MQRFTGQISDVDIRLLRIFVTVARCGGVVAAAHELNVDRSTISRQLSDLETRLGVRLCERSRAGFWLTEEGQIILEKSDELLGALSDFGRHVNEIHKELSGDFNIAVADSILYDKEFDLPLALRHFREVAPRVKPIVKIVAVSDVTAAVIGRTYQFGILPSHVKQAGLHYEPLYEQRNYLYCGEGHPLFDQNSPHPSLDQIQQEETVCLMHESRGSAQIQKLNLIRGAMTNSDEASAIHILSGIAIGYLGEHYGDRFVKEGKMRRIETPGTSYSVDVSAVVLDSKRSSGVAGLFLEHLSQLYPN